MNWTDWIYLGIGLAIGRWIWGESNSDRRVLQVSTSPADLSRDRQRELAYQMAIEMSQFKGGFLSRTSHELRSPLNGIIGVHQLILADLCENTAEEREFITQAHESALKMVQILDEAIGVARVEQGTDALELQPVQLAEMLSQVKTLTHLKAENRNLWMTIQIPEPEIFVLADPKWFRQVLLNLVNGAIDTMQQGKITLSVLSVDSDYAYVVLEDERPAEFWQESIDLLNSVLDEPLKPDSFEPKARSPEFSLLLSQTLMEAMNGRLERLAIPESEETLSRIQCSIPLVALETDQ
ncbi:sensor histidine kinase [Phormidesmis priestleyi]|uniref:sensor histidine kinase n=1 Tax=Phormidesmis priestleyi TaxID=268141 RepID=UPI00083A9F42|nr:sensor histidine kinase [Phormidesmis priestleyi]